MPGRPAFSEIGEHFLECLLCEHLKKRVRRGGEGVVCENVQVGGSTATAGSCWGRTGAWEGTEPGGVCCASGIPWYPQDVGVKSEGSGTGGWERLP